MSKLEPYRDPIAPERSNPYRNLDGYLIDWEEVYRLNKEREEKRAKEARQ